MVNVGWLGSLRRNKIAGVEVALVIGMAAVLRFVHLGYSNFQGDEISTICRLSNFPTLVKFLGYLLGQQKGPVEYVVPCAIGLIDPAFSSELALRLPSAIASLVSVASSSSSPSVCSTGKPPSTRALLVATNGMFVGQARFAQYQAFVQLGVTASLMGLILSVQDVRWRTAGLYLAALAAAGALLAHFDGAWVVPPLGIIALQWWRRWREAPIFPRLRAHLLGAGTLYALLVLGFYVEYIRRLGPHQLDYWSQRFAGSATNTLHFFQFYNPGSAIWVYAMAVILAIPRVRPNASWLMALAWLVPPLLFIELVFKDFRASAYDYILPLCLVAGIGLDSLVVWVKAKWRPAWSWAAQGMILAVLLALGHVTFELLVDHNPEYPWEPKTIAGMTVPGGNFNGFFGLPYNRDWRAIGDWFDGLPGDGQVVVTNEKLAIAMFYLPDDVRFKYIWRDAPDSLPEDPALYFLVIDRPQSWIDQVWGRTATGWQALFTPAEIFYSESGTPVAWVYRLDHAQLSQLLR